MRLISSATLDVRAGDAVVIPAGVAHKNLEDSTNFLVVGAYPQGQAWDMQKGLPDDRPQAEENIHQVPMPLADPLMGADGPLMKYWS